MNIHDPSKFGKDVDMKTVHAPKVSTSSSVVSFWMKGYDYESKEVSTLFARFVHFW